MCNLFFLYFESFSQTEGEKKPAISKTIMPPKTKIICLKKKRILPRTFKQAENMHIFHHKKKKIHNLGLP